MTTRTALLLVAGVVLLAYLPSLGASFQYDDFNVIVRDPRVQSLGAWWQSLPAIRPLLRLSYALNHVFGAGPSGLRLVNVLVHAANACLVLVLLGDLGRRCGLDARRARAVALGAALLFALHPAQTEAVTYLSGRSSSLSALFALGALLAWSRSFAGRHQRLRRGAALALGLAALAVKETAVALPLALLLWATLPGSDDDVVRRRERSSALVLALLFATAGAALVHFTPAYPDLLGAALARREPWQNLLTEARAVPYLLGHVVAPWQLNSDPDLAVARGVDAGTLLRLAALAAVVLGAFARARRQPALAFGVLWTAVWLLPSHSLLPRDDLANDRQLYLPMVGLAWLAAWLLAAAAQRAGSPVAWRRSVLGASALAVALAAGTVLRNQVYATEVSFWEAAARASPAKGRVYANLGWAYALACREADARAALTRAIALNRDDWRSRINRLMLERGELFEPGERPCDAALPGR